MRKIFFSLFLALLLLIPNTTILAMTSATKYIPDDTFFFMNINLESVKEEAKKIFDKELENQKNKITDTEEKALFEDLIQAIHRGLNKNYFLSIHPESLGLEGHILYGMDIDQEDLNLIQKAFDFNCEKDNSIEPTVLREETDEINDYCIDIIPNEIFDIQNYRQISSIINLENQNFLVDMHRESEISLLNTVLDIFNGKKDHTPLSQSEDFQTAMSNIDQDGLITMYLDYSNLIDFANKAAIAENEKELSRALNQPLIKILKSIAVSIKRNDNNIVIKSAAIGDKVEMGLQEKNFLNMSKPINYELYKQLPKAPVIAYAEQGGLASSIEETYNYFADVVDASDIAEFEEELRDIETLYEITRHDLKRIFDSNIAVAIQQNSNLPIPYFTAMADISKDKTTAEKVASKIIITLDQEINRLHETQPSSIEEIKQEKINDSFAKITISKDVIATILNDFTKEFLSDIDGIIIPQDIIENYATNTAKPITIYYGIIPNTDIFVISNADGIQNKNEEIADNELSEIINKYNNFNSGIGYFNTSKASTYIQDVVSEIINNTAINPNINFYRNYYGFLQILAYVPKAVTVSNTEEYIVKQQLIIEYTTNPQVSYKNFISNLKNTDTDNDGLNDFDEKFIYLTNYSKSDSDNDGVNDKEEIQTGSNPHKATKTFDDITETEWYAQDLMKLNKKGSITGYNKNGQTIFNPSKNVNRAEFIKMVLNAFDIPIEKTYYSSFSDVPVNEWYADYANTAYRNGYVSGEYDNKDYSRNFNGARAITRAEAIHILAKIAKLYNYSSGCATYSSYNDNPKCEGKIIGIPFEDVNENDFYANSLKYAYELKIIEGKSEGTFAPNDNLTRAEATKMISQTLEIMSKNLSEQEKVFEDDFINTGKTVQNIIY